MKFLIRATLAVTTVYLFTISSVEGLKCWSCENADSVKECDKKGRLVQCNAVQNVCGIEIRHQGSWAFPDRIKVFKFCKQANACDNVQIQNSKAAYKETQCNPKWPHSVCRCCCLGDGCNLGDLQCLKIEVPQVCSPPLNAPRNGEVQCTNGTNLASECTFQCKTGYRIIGTSRRVCGQDNKWTGVSPVCQPISCPAVSEIQNGEVTCNNGLFFGSVCTFSCNFGYRLVGPETTTCQEDENGKLAVRWSTNGQKCERKRCGSPMQAPAYGSVSCSDSYFTGSVCEFTCDGDFRRVGPKHSTCKDNYMYGRPHWDNEVPDCKKTQCPSLPNTPGNGFIACTAGRHINSVCEFGCDVEYEIVGDIETTCVQGEYGTQGLNMMWSHEVPTCKRKRCERELDVPYHGDVVCTNKDFIGSACVFSCSSIYYLDGNAKSICKESKGDDKPDWNNEAPACKRKHCESMPKAPSNGFIVCSDDEYLASVCEFSCSDAYFRVGNEFSTCTEDYKTGAVEWDNAAPQCIKKECAVALPSPYNGYMRCTDMKFLHSVCEFGCDDKYDIIGDVTSTCSEDARTGRIEWDKKHPLCVRQECDSVPVSPSNGIVECSDKNFIGSTCTYECDNAYYRVGDAVTVCTGTKAEEKPEWNNPGPICKRKRCEFLPNAPPSGYIACSDNDYRDSVCQFTCDKAYYMDGFKNTTCVENFSSGELTWNNEVPTCIRKECGSILNPPTNGFSRCTDMQYLGSICSFECDHEYDLVGSERSVCVEDYETHVSRWENESPECARKECSYMPDAPAHGHVVCTDKKYYGSICEFSCDEEYDLVGSEYTMCGATAKKSGRPVWDYESPLCIRKKCPYLNAPQNGDVVCDDKNYIGSMCEYVCDDHHRRVGPLVTSCLEDYYGYMKWSEQEMPVCERITCPELKNIQFGKMNCTDGEFVNSECNFECTVEDYKLSPHNRHSITCLNDTNWSDRAPCCARSCPPYAVMDLVVVLDSSSSIGKESWKVMLNFVNNIFELFVVKRDAMNFGVVRYNSKVDEETQIHLNDCPDNATMLQQLVSKLPYNGAGTWTGQAMTYVRDNMLKPRSGDRKNAPNVVLVITDGRSQDDVMKPAYALRDDGVLTFALAITPTNGKLDMAQLEDIAGSDSNLFLAKDGFDTLTPEFAKEISENICGDPCDRPLY